MGQNPFEDTEVPGTSPGLVYRVAVAVSPSARNARNRL